MRTHTIVRGGALVEWRVCPLLPSGLAGSGSQEEGASLTLTGGNTTGNGERKEEGEGERERNKARSIDEVCCSAHSSFNSHCSD